MMKLVFLLIGMLSLSTSFAQRKCCEKTSCVQQAKSSQSPILIRQQAQKGTGNLTIDSHHGEKLYFYLFDLEGTLIHQTILNAHEPNQVSNLKKGTYIYTVFAKDESIDEGKLVIK